MLNQDLHIHTIYSYGDSAIVDQQTIPLIAAVKHARITGISDHFDYLTQSSYSAYCQEVRKYNFKLGTEINGYKFVKKALDYEFDYYVYHCCEDKDYQAIPYLLKTGKPLIIAHPDALYTKLDKIPEDCYVEINNRYVWRFDWKTFYAPFLIKFRFIFSSDAHQPNWLNQNISKYVASELGINETMIF